MKISKKQEKSRRFNKNSIKVKLLLIPMTLVIITILAISIISSSMTKRSLTNQMKDTGEFLLHQAVDKLENNSNSLEVINNGIEENIKKATHSMMRITDELSTERLIEMSEDLEIDEINYFNNEGVLVYSNIPENLMWQPDEDHPLYAFINGEQTEMMEDIRQDPVSNDYLKYGVLKGPDGSVFQAGINANYINDLTEKFNYQNLVENLALSDEITYAVFIDKDLKAEAHSNEEFIGTELSGEVSSSAAIDGKPAAKEEKYDNIPIYNIAYPVVINDEHIGALEIGFCMDEVNSVISKNMTIIIITGLFSILLLAFILFMTSNYAIGTINKLKLEFNSMALGDFSNNGEEAEEKIYKDDEFGEIYRSMDTMKASIKAMIIDVLEKSQTLAAYSQELTATTFQSVQSANEVSRAIEDIANGSTEQALDVEKGFQTVKDLGGIVESNSNHIINLNETTKEVNSLKDEGLSLIEELVEKTNISSDSSKHVGEVIKDTSLSAERISSASEMIKNIANQTNLLALNASIEAARAGDYGKGFAVVAEEIRKLAEQSNEFTEEISNIISDLIYKTSIAVETIGQVQDTVDSQSSSVNLTSEKFTGISEALYEMEDKIGQVNNSSSEMNKQNEIIRNLMSNLSTISEASAAGSEEVSASMEEQTASITEISSASEELSRISEELNTTIEKFKI